jgi:hypothetical protein
VEDAIPRRRFLTGVGASTVFAAAAANDRHNADKLTGPSTRMGDESGIVLTSPPFNLRPKSEAEIFRVESIDTGVLVTTLYGF